MDIGSGGRLRRYDCGTKKLRNDLRFAKILSTKVDTRKIKMKVMQPWIESRLIELLGFEDDVVINFVNTQLEEQEVDGKDMQINLTGFLEGDAAGFMEELWTLLVSAQASPNGIPPEFLERKKAEIFAKKEEHERIQAEIRAKQDEVKYEMERERACIQDQISKLKQADDEQAPRDSKRDTSPERGRRRRRSRSRSPDQHRRRDR
eukprot:TRINITY_DN18878_c0_g2_i10.p1 TRINITY_DN18878_c0_g2~~TRINITY_DN18878_c0_g2_i10.p1  ORF type:complete len:205 (+),score=69.89 TRINITY_DN18878_c0_g2_i10:199-813(+)